MSSEHIDTVHEKGKLYFHSEHTIRRFFEMERFFRQATDEQLKSVLSAHPFPVDDLP